MLRILIVASELPPGPGGIGSQAAALATELAGRGHDVHLLGCQHYVTAAEGDAFNQAFPVPVQTLADRGDPARTALARAGQLRRALRSFRPDVVVASGGRMLWLADLVCGSVPYVAVIHGSELGGAGWSRRLVRRAVDHAAAVVAVSAFTRDRLLEFGTTNPRIAVIPNGADPSRFQRDPETGRRLRSQHGLGDAPLIVTIGNVTERKGQRAVVRALPQLAASVPDVQYAMVGQPSDGPAVTALARDLGVEDRIHLLGQVAAAEVVAAANAADVFAMTSTSTAAGDVEGFGIAVVEAALCGTPAVVSRGTGAEEAIVDGETGLVVDAGDPEAVAGALARLLGDAGERARMGEAAERRARSEMTWAAQLPAYEAVLAGAARNRTGRRLVVVSHTPHHRRADGEILGFGPTLRELDELAGLFDELVHVAPLHPEDPPASSLPYASPTVRFVAVPPAGGPSQVDRLRALTAVPSWALAIGRELRRADVAHVRAPAGIAMVALLVLLVRRQPRQRWVKYAGAWRPDDPGAWTYRLQRWWLRRGLARGVVTVNGRWPDEPPFVRAFDNPTLTEEELARGRADAARKQLAPPYQLAFVGRIEEPKGADVAFDAALLLIERGLDVELTLVGDGPFEATLRSRADGLGLGDRLRLTGTLPRSAVEEVLGRSHILLLPSVTEGFAKVVAEAYAFGVVPITSGVSSLGQVVEEVGSGVTVPRDARAVADACEVMLADPAGWARQRDAGVAAATRWSYPAYLDRVRTLFGEVPPE